MTERTDRIDATLARVRAQRRAEVVRNRQLIVIGTNVGYSALVPAAFTIFTQDPSKYVVQDVIFLGTGVALLFLTWYFAPQGDL